MYQSSQTFKDIDGMSLEDIQKKLNSGSFMSTNTRQSLTDRLKFLTQNDISDRFHTLSKKRETVVKKVQTKSINGTMFPDLVALQTDKQKNNIDFTKFAKDENVCHELVDKNINIYYDDILKLYNDFALLRIKLYHNELSNKIKILWTIELLKHPNIKAFHDYFKYDKLKRREEKIIECLSTCEKLNFLCEYVKILEKIYTSSTVNDEDLRFITDNRSIIFQIKYVSDFFEKHVEIIQVIEEIIDTLIKRLAERTMYPDSTDLMQKIKIYVQYLLKNIIAESDPHIDCEYYVSLHNTVQQPSEYTIMPIGASTNYYVEFDEFAEHQIEIYDRCLREITIDELENVFKEKYNSRCDDFFAINDDNKKIHINYIINDRNSIKTGTLNIVNAPPTMNIFSSMISNKPNNDIFLQRNLKKYGSNWCNKTNQFGTNKQFVDAIFDELIAVDNGIMKPYMKKSFRNLASKTSREDA